MLGRGSYRSRVSAKGLYDLRLRHYEVRVSNTEPDPPQLAASAALALALGRELALSLPRKKGGDGLARGYVARISFSGAPVARGLAMVVIGPGKMVGAAAQVVEVALPPEEGMAERVVSALRSVLATCLRFRNAMLVLAQLPTSAALEALSLAARIQRDPLTASPGGAPGRRVLRLASLARELGGDYYLADGEETEELEEKWPRFEAGTVVATEDLTTVAYCCNLDTIHALLAKTKAARLAKMMELIKIRVGKEGEGEEG